MDTEITQGSWWEKLVGHHDRGTVHQVTSVVGREVTTWSWDDEMEAVPHGGYAWRGPRERFAKEFQPLVLNRD